eukprot:6326574-Amphidinium_carterae.1
MRVLMQRLTVIPDCDACDKEQYRESITARVKWIQGGSTALHLAAIQGNVEVVESLLAMHAD